MLFVTLKWRLMSDVRCQNRRSPAYTLGEQRFVILTSDIKHFSKSYAPMSPPRLRGRGAIQEFTTCKTRLCLKQTGAFAPSKVKV